MLVEIGIGERIDCGIGRRRAPDGALAPIIRVVLMAANASSTRRTAHGLSWIRADRTALRVMTATSTAVKTGAPSGVPVLHRSRGLVMVGKKTVHILRNYDRQSKAGPRGLIRTARHTGRANRK